MLRTIMLFIATNFLIMITISIVLQIFGIGDYIVAGGIDYTSLMIFCLVWGMGFSFISLLLSKVIAKWSMRVQTVSPQSPGEYGWVATKVQELARAAQLPAMPEVGVYESAELNAFATGPSKKSSLVAVSSGLLGHMSKDAIEGVLAHEISHIANGDMVRMTLIQGVVNAFVMFVSRIAAFMAGQAVKEEMQHLVHFIVYIVCQIVFGILSMFLLSWFSRQREFRADAGAASLSGRDKMVAGLKSLQRFYSNNEIENEQPAFASLKIAGKSGGLMALLATHPPLEARIAALEALQR